MELRGKVALITGAARVGRATVLALARKGCSVAVTFRASKSSAYQTVLEAERQGVKALALQADLTQKEHVQRIVRDTFTHFGRLDILINMASVYKKRKLTNLKGQDWEEGISANLTTAYLCAVAAAPFMKKGGRIVNVSDWTAASARPRYKDLLPYYVGKGGLLSLTQALALELAPKILVNAIAPGPILPPAGLSRKENEEVVKATPLRRWGDSSEIARAVVFLCETDFVTGECIRVDGGRHLF